VSGGQTGRRGAVEEWQRCQSRRQSELRHQEHPSFATKNENDDLPAEWSVWQDESSRGSFFWDGQIGQGSARAVKVTHGCFLQKHPAKESEQYLVTAEARVEGGSTAILMVHWQRADGSWVRWDANRSFTFPTGSDQWCKSTGLVTVPKNAQNLVILLDVYNQLSERDDCRFDNVALYRVVADSNGPAPH
jgi:hypothetical protein